MGTVIIGSLAAIYCAMWLVAGLAGRRIPNNLMRMIAKEDAAFKVMLGAYGVGLAFAVVVIVMGVRAL